MSEAEAERERCGFAGRVSLLFAAIFVVAGTSMPYMPVWLDWTGLGPREIAVITATPLFVRVAVTPIIAMAADQAGDHRRFLIGLAWAGLAALIILSQARGFWPILTCTLLFALAWTTVMPLTETVAMRGVRAAGLDYGRMRVWGSLSFIAASFCGGWVVERLGSGSAVWLVIAGMALTTAAAHGLVRPIGLGRLKAATSPPRLEFAGAISLLSSRVFLVFLLAAGAVQAAHAVLYTFGTLHWRALGLSAEWCGALWAIAIIAEVGLFAFSRTVVARIGAVGLVVLGAGSAVARWLAMGFDPPLALLLPLQVLHGFTFGATHLGAIHFMSRAVPEAQAGTAQALYASVTGGIAMGGTMLVAGPLYAAYAGGAYWAMAVVAAVGLIASLVLLTTEPCAHRAE
ncbi:MAG TPA: MFS transporter [Dongiaceae bacterium]|jgi:PPP family 3-phenylpropionic acid transporter|nr:MFS transporter [Dongiaceae bacterium]